MQDTNIDMAAINRIKSMGSRKLKEKSETLSHKPFPNSQIDSDNTSMRKRYEYAMNKIDKADNSDDETFSRELAKSDFWKIINT